MPAVMIPCAECGTVVDATSTILKLSMSKNGDVETDVCLPCWGKQGRAPLAAQPEIAWPADPRSVLGASKHPSIEAANARMAKIAEYLGHRNAEIWPNDPSASAFFVLGDSPLVPGAKLVKNPLA